MGTTLTTIRGRANERFYDDPDARYLTRHNSCVFFVTGYPNSDEKAYGVITVTLRDQSSEAVVPVTRVMEALIREGSLKSGLSTTTLDTIMYVRSSRQQGVVVDTDRSKHIYYVPQSIRHAVPKSCSKTTALLKIEEKNVKFADKSLNCEGQNDIQECTYHWKYRLGIIRKRQDILERLIAGLEKKFHLSLIGLVGGTALYMFSS